MNGRFTAPHGGRAPWIASSVWTRLGVACVVSALLWLGFFWATA